jgi:ferredoxin, 2Fe-2S
MVRIRVTDRSGATLLLEARVGEPVMHSLRAEAGVEATCGGSASCGTCHVYVEGGWIGRLPDADANERSLLDGLLDVRPTSRISCQIVVVQSMEGLALVVAPDG